MGLFNNPNPVPVFSDHNDVIYQQRSLLKSVPGYL